MPLSPGALAAAARVEQQFANAPRLDWVGSPFEWLLELPSRTRGAAGEELLAQWLTEGGAVVERPKNSDFDRLVNGRRVEVKMSTLWRSGMFRFQQLRDQDYDDVALLGIAPFEVYLWWLPKAVAWGASLPQHTGSTGADTRWLEVSPEAPPAALRCRGGLLAETVEHVLLQLPRKDSNLQPHG